MQEHPRRLVDLTETDLRRIVREEVAALLATVGLAKRASLTEPCAFCPAKIATTCEHVTESEVM